MEYWPSNSQLNQLNQPSQVERTDSRGNVNVIIKRFNQMALQKKIPNLKHQLT